MSFGLGIRTGGAGRVRLLNRLLRRGWAAGMPRPVLEPDALVAAARARAGLRDLGPESVWRDNLQAMTDAIGREAALSPLGATMAWGQIVAALADRMRARALWARHPEIVGIPIERPVIVLGQMRSGTTRVHRLLACDPRFAHTRFFESWNGVPGGGRQPGIVDARRWRAAAGLVGLRLLNPGFAALHPTGAGEPDEEIGLLSLSLYGSTFEAQWRVPSFARWCEERDTRPVYQEFAALMRTIAWARGDKRPRPWVMKVPQFTQDLASVLNVFPDARIVRVVRDPADVVASAAALSLNQMQVQSDAVEPAWIGREWVRKVRLREERVAAALAARPDVPVVTLGWDEVDRDWRGAMGRVYAMLGEALTSEVEVRMARYLARAAREKRARKPPLEAFGLTAEEVRRAVG